MVAVHVIDACIGCVCRWLSTEIEMDHLKSVSDLDLRRISFTSEKGPDACNVCVMYGYPDIMNIPRIILYLMCMMRYSLAYMYPSGSSDRSL